MGDSGIHIRANFQLVCLVVRLSGESCVVSPANYSILLQMSLYLGAHNPMKPCLRLATARNIWYNSNHHPAISGAFINSYQPTSIRTICGGVSSNCVHKNFWIAAYKAGAHFPLPMPCIAAERHGKQHEESNEPIHIDNDFEYRLYRCAAIHDAAPDCVQQCEQPSEHRKY